MLAIRLSVGNYASLPAKSWVNLWFDLDSDQGTGAAGDEALVRYQADGGVELFAWNGSQLVQARRRRHRHLLAAGVLTVSLPRASIAAGRLRHARRELARAVLGEDELIASDYAPDAGRSTYAGRPTTFPDPAGDHDAAPDVTSVRVSDAKSGWITFAITTPNYATLPSESAIVLTVDRRRLEPGDRRGWGRAAGHAGRGEVVLDRWNTGGAGLGTRRPSAGPRARREQPPNVVAIDLHVRELDNARRFGFSLLSADRYKKALPASHE